MTSAPYYNGELRQRVERCLGIDKSHFDACILDILAASNVEYKITPYEEDNYIQKLEAEVMTEEEEDEILLRIYGPKLSRNKESFSDCSEYIQRINELLLSFS